MVNARLLACDRWLFRLSSYNYGEGSRRPTVNRCLPVAKRAGTVDQRGSGAIGYNGIRKQQVRVAANFRERFINVSATSKNFATNFAELRV